MDLVSRKMSFVQEFLRISDEDLIAKLERLLWSEKKKSLSTDFNPMTIEVFNEMVNKAENDFKNGRVTEAKELLGNVETWK